MTHMWRHDFRKDSLYTILNGLESSKLVVQQKINVNDWYDGIFAREECEPIIGMAFLTCQSYINKSIVDLQTSYFTDLKKYQIYRKYENLKDFNCNAIELVIALANYFKHEHDNTLDKNTKIVLDVFNLNYIDPDIVDCSPLFKGIELIDDNWNFISLAEIVCDWRENLWQEASEI